MPQMIFQIDQVGFSRGTQKIVSGISAELHSGEAIWITGSNGSGKTSLLRLLSGLSYPTVGEIRRNGENIAALGEEFFKELLYCGHVIGIKDDLTALENVLISTRLSGKDCSEADALRALEQMELEHKSHIATRSLSMGQKKRVALARLCIRPLPALLILDEPFSALDLHSIEFLCQLLTNYLAQGGMLIYTTHQEISLHAKKIHRLDLNRRDVKNDELC